MADAESQTAETLAVVGDVHGHLQLALCLLARWQRELRIRFSAVLLCGDVGTFTESTQLDNATLQHARENPCELEFLEQWSTDPPAPWLEHIFAPEDEGLGLTCPVVMVHGNHEGFDHLARLCPGRPPVDPVAVEALPVVDAGGFVRLLPSGWRFRTPGGHLVAGVGGIETGQRRANYHEMAYVDDSAVLALSSAKPSDVLITHQGPACIHSEIGSPTLDLLLEIPAARVWFHGHGGKTLEATPAGPEGRCTVVPLGDVAFAGRGANKNDPGLDGWCLVTLRDGEASFVRELPAFWRDYRRPRWRRTRQGLLVCPDLVPYVDFRELEP